MHTFRGQQQYGFTATVVFSILLHLAAFIPYLYFKEPSRRIFIAPVYTVDLVSLPQDSPKKVKKTKKTKKTVPKVKKKKKAVKKSSPKPVKRKETTKKVAAITPQVEKIRKKVEKDKKIADALKEIEREAKLREEDLKTDKVIERIEDREKSKEQEARLKQEFEQLRQKEETAEPTGLKDKLERLEAKRRIKELELKALEDIKEIREKERLREEDLMSVSDLPVGKRLIAGRDIDKSGSKLLDIRFENYYMKIWERIQGAWILPENIPGDLSGLETIVGISIGKDGRVLKKRIEKGSGSAIYDKSTLRAIEKSDPLPPLPEGFRGNAFAVGIRFRDSENY
ncbi:MAG: TonB family protein [Thermodesulfobacteriota bacterium]